MVAKLADEKAKQIEKAILRIRDDKEDIAFVFKELGLNYKANTYYSLKPKYEKYGIEGLMSKKSKCGRKPIKGNRPVIEFIRKEKQGCPVITAKELKKKLATSFATDISVSQINRLIAKMNLDTTKGRPIQEREIELAHAGLFIFLSAILETNYINELLAVQQNIIENERGNGKEKLCGPGLRPRGLQEEKGVFSKDEKGKFIDYPKEHKDDYEKNGGVSNKFKSVSERIKNRDLNRLTIFQVREETLYRKNLTLLCLPIITEHSRFSELNETKGNELKYFCGYDYKSSTIDKYAREMKYLQSSHLLMQHMASFWFHLWQDKNSGTTSQVCYYFDGNTRPLWSSYPVKQSKISKVGRVMGCLEEVYIHSGQGHPLMLQTFSGGVYLPDAIKKLNAQLDKIIPETFSRVSIFDAGANSVDFYETFNDKEYFICILNDNQYKQDLSDMVIGESKTIDNNIYVEADKKLKNSKTGELFSARTIAYKHTNKNRFTAFVTNIPKDNMNSTEVVENYYKRWPKQELQFRDMNNGGDISTNYGYGKLRVINLVVQKNMKYICGQIKSKNEKIEYLNNKIIGLENSEIKKKAEIEKQIKDSELKIKQTENDIEQALEKTKIPKLLKVLKINYGKIEKNKANEIIIETKTNTAKTQIENQKKRQDSLLKKHKTEYERIKKKELVYENDIELNQLLSTYKIAFANLSAYIVQEYFPGLTISIEKLINKILKRPGKLVIKGTKKEIQIYLNEKDNNISKQITKACQIINSKLIQWEPKNTINLVPVHQKK